MVALEILQTKLTPPRVRPDRVHRPRLAQRFATRPDCRLTLVCAPAGYGKSALLSEWFGSETAVPIPFGWLSLDADDNDPVRFLMYLISAVAHASGMDAGEMLALLHSPQPPPPKTILMTLIHRLESASGQIVLALDDYHVIITPTIHNAMTYLLDHLPTHVFMVIASREDPPFPLARLRGRRQLTEIRAADLRFTLQEIEEFLAQMVGMLLDATQVRDLDVRTEGWVAGLQLAALAMKDRHDIDRFITAFTGSHRYILDYLTDEVLSQQPEATRMFLLQTSILNRLSGSLCDAVTGGSGGQVMLEEIEHGNLFLIALDDERYWFRYHHLFRDMLLRQLQHTQSDLVIELHRRASVWFEANGWVIEALEHALLSQGMEQAARLVQQTVEEITIAGQAQTILRWIHALPESVVRAYPRLCVYYATTLMFTNQLEAAETWLQAAEHAIYPDSESDEARSILGWVAIIRADIARVLGDLTAAVELAHRALALLPSTEPLARAVGVMNVADAYLANGDVTPPVEQTAVEATAALRSIGNLFATMISITNHARLQIAQGRLRQAKITFELAERIAPGKGRVGELLNGAAFHVGLGRAGECTV